MHRQLLMLGAAMLLAGAHTAGAQIRGSSDESLGQRANAALERYQGEGFRRDSQENVVLISSDRLEEFAVELTKGVDYAFVAVCGAGCDNVTVALVDSSRRSIASSTGRSASTGLRTTVSTAGSYALRVMAVGCRRALCSVRTFVFLKDSQAGSIARKPSDASPKPAPKNPAVAGELVYPNPTDTSVQSAVTSTREAERSKPFQDYDNYDVEGFDLAIIKNSETDSCASTCLGNSKCRLYSFDKWNKVCFLKHGADELIFTPRSLTAVRSGGTAPRFSTGGITFERFRNRSFPPSTQDARASASMEACQDLCLKTQTCAAFTFFKSAKKCMLFSRTDVYQPNLDADSGAKRQSASDQ